MFRVEMFRVEMFRVEMFKIRPINPSLQAGGNMTSIKMQDFSPA
jgi:hypothetical protein